MHLLDMFDYNHDGISHNCLVFSLMGISLQALLEKNEYRRLPRLQIRDIAYQLLKSLACKCLPLYHNFRLRASPVLHKYSIAHTDLKPDNILLRSGKLLSIPQSNVSLILFLRTIRGRH